MLSALMKNVFNEQEQMGDVNRYMENLRKNTKEMLEIQKTL